jgi:nitrogen fixation protein NifU and related proteins
MDRSEVLELILDHYENPRHYGEMPDADVSLQGGNPGCGDIITVYLKFDQDVLKDFTFTGKGCTISQSAASMLTEIVTGFTKEQIQALDYHIIEELIGEELVKTRPKCATLALDTLRFAAKQQKQK